MPSSRQPGDGDGDVSGVQAQAVAWHGLSGLGFSHASGHPAGGAKSVVGNTLERHSVGLPSITQQSDCMRAKKQGLMHWCRWFAVVYVACACLN
jgi:hypothetical protein